MKPAPAGFRYHRGKLVRTPTSTVRLNRASRPRNSAVTAAVRLVLAGAAPKDAARETGCHVAVLRSRLKSMRERGELPPGVYDNSSAARRMSEAARNRAPRIRDYEEDLPPEPDWLAEELAS